MKLLEYRFPKLGQGEMDGIGRVLASVFKPNGDDDLVAVYGEDGRLRHEQLLVDTVATVLADSIGASHSRQGAELAKIVTVKSSRTCRFVAVEYDGLVRVRLAQDDTVPDAGSWGVAARDVSEVLTSTDLYDLI